ncbi:hypothetical protein C5L22_20160 [Pantoea ananatis]|nr:hypothetical protein C5L22_20160 [Pantoea ananatis]
MAVITQVSSIPQCRKGFCDGSQLLKLYNKLGSRPIVRSLAAHKWQGKNRVAQTEPAGVSKAASRAVPLQITTAARPHTELEEVEDA